ncbi:hypothetical protein Hypma_007520 [Hypsizygus marmoreus]|uniref:BZIP domain-containing protein n=1 Tax=Hypsizygus marmoreus TaxID=39966 RepID=A0A369K0W4_HYPMA|nr:hypothetical protein Hypma_007520 [Hypsizygus marmoreus]
MAPNLQGLNIVHPVQAHSDSHDLLSGQAYPDLSAQLDLWTNLAFDCDEKSLGPKSDDNDKYRRKSTSDEDEEDGTSHGSGTGESAIHDGHINVVTGTNVPIQPAPAPAFDLNTFLAGFGIDPFSAPPVHNNQNQGTGISPSLAQLIALHSAQGGAPGYLPPPPPPNATRHQRSTDEAYPPAAKRTRTRKSSVSTVESPEEQYREETPNPSAGPVSAAEDKRRRNTAASARFRLKKKEREAALEGKAKELEGRVNELERECEGLRRENGWLKGLVVGVTGAAQAPSASVSVGTKRGRDEIESA